MFVPRVVGLEDTMPTVVMHQSVTGTDPESILLVGRHRTHIVVWQDAG